MENADDTLKDFTRLSVSFWAEGLDVFHQLLEHRLALGCQVQLIANNFRRLCICRILLVCLSLSGFGGSQADGEGALVVGASLAADLGRLGPQHPVHNDRICLALLRG